LVERGGEITKEPLESCYHADAEGRGRATAAERGGHTCGRVWSWHPASVDDRRGDGGAAVIRLLTVVVAAFTSIQETQICKIRQQRMKAMAECAKLLSAGSYRNVPRVEIPKHERAAK